jgi:hypothetical protein
MLKQLVHLTTSDHALFPQPFDMIDVEPGQVEQTRHPRDDRYNMQRFGPKIPICQKPAHLIPAIFFASLLLKEIES